MVKHLSVGTSLDQAEWESPTTHVGNGLIKITVITSGSGNFALNANTRMIIVEGVGGGGGGGSANTAGNTTCGAGGGGSGGYFWAFIESPNSSYAYNVGTGGAGGGAGGANGSAGSNTTFDLGGALNLVAGGGEGGQGMNVAANNVALKFCRGGNGGVASANNFNANTRILIPGQAGGFGTCSNSTSLGAVGGLGGATLYSMGGRGGFALAANVNSPGNDAQGYGGGGGGGAISRGANSAGNAIGGNGAPGVLIIYEYC